MIETLRGLTTIGNVKVMTNDDRPIIRETGIVDWNAFDEMREEFPICIDHDNDMISFKMLTKPANEGGNMKLCQLTDLISASLAILESLDAKYPCRENTMTIQRLKEALVYQASRTANRTARGVEGKNVI